MTFDPTVMDCPQQPKQKLFKEQKNLSRKQDLRPVDQAERAKKQMLNRPTKDEGGANPVPPHNRVEVHVEINLTENTGDKPSPHPLKSYSKHKPSTHQKKRRNPLTPSPSPDGNQPPCTVTSSPSHSSIISETAAEELCHLRNYYSKQLRRINYISHEYLGALGPPGPTEPGVLACLTEPLRSFRRLPRVNIGQTARSLWTRVSGRRKLIR